jgi:hypothetical protein
MVTVNENERTTPRAWVNTDTVNAYVVNTVCVELYQAHAKYTHTHYALAFQTRRVTSNCNYPRTTIIDCYPGLQPCSRLKLGKYAFSYTHTHTHTHTQTAHWMRCARSWTRQSMRFTSPLAVRFMSPVTGGFVTTYSSGQQKSVVESQSSAPPFWCREQKISRHVCHRGRVSTKTNF